jgi:hypothetical protein
MTTEKKAGRHKDKSIEPFAFMPEVFKGTFII